MLGAPDPRWANVPSLHTRTRAPCRPVSSLTLFDFLLRSTLAMADECPVCMEPCQNFVVGPCFHKFCATCARDWLSRKSECPSCRSPMEPHDVVSLGPDFFDQSRCKGWG